MRRSLSLGFSRRGLGKYLGVMGWSLISIISMTVHAQSVSSNHRTTASPGAVAAGFKETAVSLPAGQSRVAAEYSGSLASRTIENLLGINPVPMIAGAVGASGANGDESLTPNSVIRNLPSIESRLPGGESQETIFGADDRRRITSTTAVPYRWECQLVITMPNGDQYIGTGWLAGPRLVMTAGHCVHDGGQGKKWAKRIEVIPGMNGSSRPYGTFVSTAFLSTQGWTQNGNFDYDYGCILLPSRVGDSLGYMGFASYSNSTLLNMTLNSAGYPGDKPFGTQWFTTGRATRVDNFTIYTRLDIRGGQSGSPVWRLTNGNRYAVGIVSADNPQTNFLLRINDQVFANIKNWRTR